MSDEKDLSLPSPDTFLDRTFGEGGYLAQRFSGYRPRPSQLALARAVDHAIVHEEYLMAEGATGVGKSLAYSAAATYRASIAHGRILAARTNPDVPNGGEDDMAPARVLVVTAGITLSEQLINKDLPLLQEVVPWPFTFALMKGRNNFLCSDAYYDTDVKGHGFLPNADETDQIEDIRAWAKDVFEGFAKGDVSELPFEPTPRVWRNFSVMNDECKGKDCDFYKSCPSNASHAIARKANVIVTNYHMLFAHLQVMRATRMHLVLPACDTIILDECFPHGTLVGQTEIQDLRVGDLVPSWDTRGSIIYRTVKTVFRSVPSRMVLVIVGDRSVACTAGHPFMTRRGWVAASQIQPEDEVLCAREESLQQGRHRPWKTTSVRRLREHGVASQREKGLGPTQAESSFLLHRPSEKLACQQHLASCVKETNAAAKINPLPRMWLSSRDRALGHVSTNMGTRKTRKHLLQRAAQETLALPSSECAHAKGCYDERGQDLGSHAPQQPHAFGCHTRSRKRLATPHRTQAAHAGRERTWTNDAGGHPPESPWRRLEDQHDRSNETPAQPRLPKTLQNRHRQPDVENRNRGRREIPLLFKSKNDRPKEGLLLAWNRVDRVQVLERGRNGTYGGVCPDGYVYNVEVDETHTYIANGFVVHNCHKAPEIARDFFGFRITQEMIGRTARALKRDGEDHERQLEKELRTAAGLFFSCLLAYKASGRYKTRIKEPLTEDEGMLGVWCGLEAAMLAVEKVLTNWSNQLNYVIGDGRGSKEEKARMAALERSCSRSAELRGCVRTAMELTNAEDHVYFIDTNEKQQVLLVGKPIDVGPILEDALFRKTPTVVCTSATMCVRDSFDFIATEVGCSRYAALVAESPFDWERQALLVLPDWVPEPNVPEFRDAVVDATERVVAQAKGRTLGLFTSRKMLDYVFDAMKKSCRYRLLKQGQMPRTKLIEVFKQDESSVLLGTESFWAGVDVPGKALSAVVIDRLPFPAPDDPIADAMSLRDPKRWFRHYSIPRAVIQLKQGFGRLIRSVDDLGVAVILDRRVLHKPYGKIFLKSLPRELPITTRIEDIGPFLNRKSPDEIDEMSSTELEDAFT